MRLAICLIGTLLSLFACASPKTEKVTTKAPITPTLTPPQVTLDTAIFAAGCFWCIEAQLKMLEGVDTVLAGYTGGHKKNPTYLEVSMGKTGHAEAVAVVYKPAVISYNALLEAFFSSHDPTQLNRQGNDVGTQYRSAIFPHNAYQKERASYYIQELTNESVYKQAIATRIEPLVKFYQAEEEHQDFFRRNPSEAYCQYVIIPKLEKFKRIFSAKLKP